MMQKFVITFGSGKPGICDGWVEVAAHSEDIARWWARETYGPCWSMLYSLAEFERYQDLDYYPLGCLGQETLWHTEVPA